MATSDQNAFEASVQRVRMRPRMFYTLTIAWILLILIASITAFLTWNNTAVIPGVPLGLSITSALVIWIAVSFRVIGVNEVAAVVLYNLPMIRVRRGPKLIVTGMFQLYRFAASVKQNQFPDDPELIQKGDDKIPLEMVDIHQLDGTTLRRQKVRPIRINTAKPKESLGEDDILNVQMTVEFTFWVRWIVTDPFEIIINVNGDLNEVVRQMRDAGESLLNNQVTQLTPSELIAGFKGLRDALFAAIKQSVQDWGVEVIDVGLTAPDLSHELAAALRNIPVAKAEARKKIIDAEAERVRLGEEGKGRGKAREEELAGEGRGYKRAGKQIGVPAEKMLEAQVARETVGEADLILGTEGIAQVIGLGKQLLNKEKSANQRRDDSGETE